MKLTCDTCGGDPWCSTIPAGNASTYGKEIDVPFCPSPPQVTGDEEILRAAQKNRLRNPQGIYIDHQMHIISSSLFNLGFEGIFFTKPFRQLTTPSPSPFSHDNLTYLSIAQACRKEPTVTLIQFHMPHFNHHNLKPI